MFLSTGDAAGLWPWQTGSMPIATTEDLHRSRLGTSQPLVSLISGMMSLGCIRCFPRDCILSGCYASPLAAALDSPRSSTGGNPKRSDLECATECCSTPSATTMQFSAMPGKNKLSVHAH